MNAVSVYGQDGGLDDFPVLKAFQQYIDAEHEKARKRVLSLCIFFGCLMSIVVAVFVALLMKMTSQNQLLNDRLVDFAMRERSQQMPQVVVQQPQTQATDATSAGIQELATRLDDFQKKLAEEKERERREAEEAKSRAQAEAAAKAAEKAVQEKAATEQEVLRLKALLAAQRDDKEREKARIAAEKRRKALEKEQKRQQELEEYRRKHYPELYAPPPSARATTSPSGNKDDSHADIDAIIDLVDDVSLAPRNYFDENEDAAEAPAGKKTSVRKDKKPKKQSAKAVKKPLPAKPAQKPMPAAQPDTPTGTPPAQAPESADSDALWDIPTD